MITTIDNVNAGITWWLNNKWPIDFLNADYYKIYDIRSDGATKEWWSATVERLGQWRAYRSPYPPNTKAEITALGNERLERIGTELTKLARAGSEPSISALSWEEIAPFFTLVSEIKPGSIVFAGKTCHFTFPKLFVVMDNAATSVFHDYEFYWRGMKDEWSRFTAKSEAKNLMWQKIKSASNNDPHPAYPFETKILELCHIGHNHR